MPDTAKNCRGGAAAGVCVVIVGAAGFGRARFDLANALPASETTSAPAASATSSFNLTDIGDPFAQEAATLLGRAEKQARS
jgi:hypothetical protein